MPALAVIGSRSWTNQDRIFEYLDRLNEKTADLLLVSGACPKGADYIAELWAKKKGIPILLYPADWSTGKAAGFKRNQKIVNASDAVIAFWDGESKGTIDSVERAWRLGKKVLIATPYTKRVVEVKNFGDLADISSQIDELKQQRKE